MDDVFKDAVVVNSAESEIWYALKCNGKFVPVKYATEDYLDASLVRDTKDECIELCDSLNAGN